LSLFIYSSRKINSLPLNVAINSILYLDIYTLLVLNARENTDS